MRGEWEDDSRETPAGTAFMVVWGGHSCDLWTDVSRRICPGMNGEQAPEKLTWSTPRVRFRVLVLSLLGACFCYAFFTWVLWPVKVSGQSMLPNYRDGSRYLINKLAYWSEPPQRGHVVALRYGSGDVLMKRILALPGETVGIYDGDLYVNGTVVVEDYVEGEIPRGINWEVKLGSDQYFVIGDNRSVSVFGAIQREQIIGKVVR
jgi:signal peptidase I